MSKLKDFLFFLKRELSKIKVNIKKHGNKHFILYV